MSGQDIAEGLGRGALWGGIRTCGHSTVAAARGLQPCRHDTVAVAWGRDLRRPELLVAVVLLLLRDLRPRRRHHGP